MSNQNHQSYELTDTIHYLFSPMSQFNSASLWGSCSRCFIFPPHIVSNITWGILFICLSCVFFFALYDFMWPGTHKLEYLLHIRSAKGFILRYKSRWELIINNLCKYGRALSMHAWYAYSLEVDGIKDAQKTSLPKKKTKKKKCGQ